MLPSAKSSSRKVPVDPLDRFIRRLGLSYTVTPTDLPYTNDIVLRRSDGRSYDILAVTYFDVFDRGPNVEVEPTLLRILGTLTPAEGDAPDEEARAFFGTDYDEFVTLMEER